MRAVVQRVRDGSVTVDGTEIGRVDHGLLVYLGVGTDDDEKDVLYIVDKIVHLRIFPDAEGKMNLSLKESGGGVLVISQFTLYGDTRGARRPSYSRAADSTKAQTLYNRSIELFRERGVAAACGEFGAMMDVAAVNCGPVTIMIDSEKTL
jgi:D-tyrosyl-tRNA(Tyr) deacylase